MMPKIFAMSPTIHQKNMVNWLRQCVQMLHIFPTNDDDDDDVHLNFLQFSYFWDTQRLQDRII